MNLISGVSMLRKKAFISFLLLTTVLSVAVAGQKSKRAVRSSGSQRSERKPVAKASPSPAAAFGVNQPVTLVSGGQPEYLSGGANVAVKGNQNPIIRLGLAQNGVNVIEFPASDSFFMIHPGNSDLVALDQDTAEASLRTLVLRAGAAFVAPAAGSPSHGPSASISVQMRSGLVVTLLIYPVRELSQNAHRCVVMYNRDEVVASRRAAGLAVNLCDKKDDAKCVGGEEQQQKRGAGAIKFGEYPAQPDGAPTVLVRGGKPGLIADVKSERADERVRSGKTSKKSPKTSEAANRALKDALKTPARVGEFSKPVHGLSMAVSAATDLDAGTRVLVVAVKNESKGDLRIVSGNPELYVQTFDDQGKALQIEQVKKLQVESTSLDNKIGSGGVAYYSIVYEAPAMGARQRLRVSVSQTDAADEPATT